LENRMPTHEPEDRSSGPEEHGQNTAFITGVTGQDGSYLAEFLLSKGYTVYGLVRHVRGREEGIHEGILRKINVVEGSTEYGLGEELNQIQPTEIYNLAAESFVGKSWPEWRKYAKINGIGAVNIFEAARLVVPKARIYQASTSELFGNAPAPQSETTPMVPRSPYGASKLYAHQMARIYRESYGMHISCGICFNHESPRRGEEFVSRKIAGAVARRAKEGGKIEMGSIEPKRDWGHALDYVNAMWMMLQAPVPDDYVVATGKQHSVGDFLKLAFSYAGLIWSDHYIKDPQFVRPNEVNDLRGDASKIQSVLGWEPTYTFDTLVREMVMAEMEAYDDEQEREAPASLHGSVQSEVSGEVVRGGVSGEDWRTEAGIEGAGRKPPNFG
jgi:GDPmannose 4,6-dehydratase